MNLRFYLIDKMKTYKLQHFKQNPYFHFALNFLLFFNTYIFVHFRSFYALFFRILPVSVFILEISFSNYDIIDIPILPMYFHAIVFEKHHFIQDNSQDILVVPISSLSEWWAFYPFFTNAFFQWILWCFVYSILFVTFFLFIIFSFLWSILDIQIENWNFVIIS